MKVKDIRNWLDVKMKGLNLEKLITHFAHSNRSEGKSPKTVSWYSDMLLDFVKYLKQAERRQKKEEEAALRKAEQPALFTF